MKIHSYLFSKHHLIKLLVAFVWLTSMASYGDVIFSDNFDATPDWQNHGSQRCNWIGWDKDAGDTSCANLPLNYDLMYMSDENPTNPMCQINSKGKRGVSGKGLKVYDESNGDDNSWGSDCQIAKYFPKQYPEVWASYYIHYNPNMIWDTGTKMSKIFRIGHYNPQVVDGTAQTSAFNTNNTSTKNGGLGDTTASLFFLDVKQVTSSDLMRLQEAVRCGGEYKCGTYDEAWFQNFTGTPGDSWSDTLGDNKWHHIEVHVKMNSKVGANDGVLEVYFDGVLQTKANDIPWRMAGTKSTVTGFNMFTIAGNSNNVWAGQTNEEQWMYDVDDVTICTSRCPGTGAAPKPPIIQP
jgi:hypothetical protein